MGEGRQGRAANLPQAGVVWVKEEKKAGGLVEGLMDFLRLIEDMEKKGLSEKTISGEKELLGGRARYSYTTRIGFLRKDREPLGSRATTPWRSTGTGRLERAVPWKSTPSTPALRVVEKEKLVGVEEKGGSLLITAELPTLDESAVRCAVKGNKLKISATAHGEMVEKEIPVPEGSRIKSTAFKNGVLEIVLKKKKGGK